MPIEIQLPKNPKLILTALQRCELITNFYSDLSLKEGRMGKMKQINSPAMQQCLETRFNLFDVMLHI